MKKIGIVYFFLLSFASLVGAQEGSEWASSTSAPLQTIVEPSDDLQMIPVKKKADHEWGEDTFELPAEQSLVGCAYAASFSYPYLCVDRKRKIVFDLDRGDDQSVLDKIIRKQGKQNGRYNKLPKK